MNSALISLPVPPPAPVDGSPGIDGRAVGAAVGGGTDGRGLGLGGAVEGAADGAAEGAGLGDGDAAGAVGRTVSVGGMSREKAAKIGLGTSVERLWPRTWPDGTLSTPSRYAPARAGAS